jgi:hypothetical protein
MTKFCTHISVIHEEPEDFPQAYENLTHLISSIQGLFWVIREILSNSECEVAEVAELGFDLTQELARRAEVLNEFNTADEPAATEHGKEG